MTENASAKRPNIIFFQCDDLDHNDFGGVGKKLMTPNIDRVMQRGVEFRQAYCSSALCTPSRYEYLTGRYAASCEGKGFKKGNSLVIFIGQARFLEWGIPKSSTDT